MTLEWGKERVNFAIYLPPCSGNFVPFHFKLVGTPCE